jgi:hypothetical protein
MSRSPYKLPLLLGAFTLCATLLFPRASAHQQDPQAPAASPTKTVAYFPPGTISANLFSEYLSYFGEPSLFAASQDPSAHSYRLDWLSGQHGYVLTARIVMKSEGGAEVIAVEQFPKSAVPHRTQNSISAAETKKFCELVDKADFWTMPVEAEEDRKIYKFDASPWVFEGVRHGSYHIVVRLSPRPSPFTDMVHFLTKDIARLDESAVPHAN